MYTKTTCLSDIRIMNTYVVPAILRRLETVPYCRYAAFSWKKEDFYSRPHNNNTMFSSLFSLH